MKRWLRRILLACSIGLAIVSGFLWVRAYFKGDDLMVGSLMLANRRTFFLVGKLNPPDFGFQSHAILHPMNSILIAPKIIPSHPNIGPALVLPHWLLISVGAAYPTFLWLRHRRQKKVVGFPVEVSASKPRVEASEAATSAR